MLISSSLAYIRGRLNPPRNPCLVMTILVCNEADIIADNILFHSQQGVDAFVVGDNASDDGTREKVELLAKNLPILIADFPDGQYCQTLWRTHMAHLAYRRFNAWWVISNDADEFYFARSGNIKQELNWRQPAIRIKRFNMLGNKDHRPYYLSPWRVAETIPYAKSVQKGTGKMSLSLVKIAPKIIANPRGLIAVRGGNHRAHHLFSPKIPPTAEHLHIYHFPQRGYEEFLQNARQRTKLLTNAPNTSMGMHNHRWVKLLKEGRLREEYENLIYSDAEAHILERLGFVVEDNRFAERFVSLGLS